MAKWYSEEMKNFHLSNKGDSYYVYHWFYKGRTRDWDASDLRWGYVGIAPYQLITERYKIELKECVMKLRPRKRKVIQMLERYWPEEKIGFRIVGGNLKRNEALQIEGALRPASQTSKFDRRIWNEVAGG
jgi:hypothetical protein